MLSGNVRFSRVTLVSKKSKFNDQQNVVVKDSFFDSSIDEQIIEKKESKIDDVSPFSPMRPYDPNIRDDFLSDSPQFLDENA